MAQPAPVTQRKAAYACSGPRTEAVEHVPDPILLPARHAACLLPGPIDSRSAALCQEPAGLLRADRPGLGRHRAGHADRRRARRGAGAQARTADSHARRRWLHRSGDDNSVLGAFDPRGNDPSRDHRIWDGVVQRRPPCLRRRCRPDEWTGTRDLTPGRPLSHRRFRRPPDRGHNRPGPWPSRPIPGRRRDERGGIRRRRDVRPPGRQPASQPGAPGWGTPGRDAARTVPRAGLCRHGTALCADDPRRARDRHSPVRRRRDRPGRAGHRPCGQLVFCRRHDALLPGRTDHGPAGTQVGDRAQFSDPGPGHEPGAADRQFPGSAARRHADRLWEWFQLRVDDDIRRRPGARERTG